MNIHVEINENKIRIKLLKLYTVCGTGIAEITAKDENGSGDADDGQGATSVLRLEKRARESRSGSRGPI